jgi:hypothetical protein
MSPVLRGLEPALAAVHLDRGRDQLLANFNGGNTTATSDH